MLQLLNRCIWILPEIDQLSLMYFKLKKHPIYVQFVFFNHLKLVILASEYLYLNSYYNNGFKNQKIIYTQYYLQYIVGRWKLK